MSADPRVNIQAQRTMTVMVGSCMRVQLKELSMLRAIFSKSTRGTANKTTFSVVENGAADNFDAFLDGCCELPCTQIHYIFGIPLVDKKTAPAPSSSSQQQQQQHLDVHITLPQLYPLLEMPDVSVLSTALTNDVLRRMRLDVEKYMFSLLQRANDGLVFDVISWLQTHAGSYTQRTAAAAAAAARDNNHGRSDYPMAMERLWIRTGLMTNNDMRQKTLQLAKRLDLSGWQRPGAPGHLCVEGPEYRTQEFWKEVRNFHWQKISLLRTDTQWASNDDEAQQFRCFPDVYCDMGVDNRAILDSNTLFVQFLEKHNCGDARLLLFR